MHYFDIKKSVFEVFEKHHSTQNHIQLAEDIMTLPMPHHLVGLTELTSILKGVSDNEAENLRAAVAIAMEDLSVISNEKQFEMLDRIKDMFFHIKKEDYGKYRIAIDFENVAKFLKLRGNARNKNINYN